MDEMIESSTLDTGHTDGTSYSARTMLQTTLYDLMQAMQDEAEPHEEHLVVDAVMQLLRRDQIRFFTQRAQASTACFDEAFPISA